jgi:Protein of unknown function (DUF1800)
MLSPLAPSRWNFDTAAHLVVRAGFGGSPPEIEKVQALGLEKAVDQLVEATPDPDPPPAWADLRVQNDLRTQIQQTLTHESPQSGRKLQSEQFRNETNDLTFWWVCV